MTIVVADQPPGAASPIPASPARPSMRGLARSTLIVMIAFGVAKVISLGQTVLIADVFGVGQQWDSYVTANRIPEQIFNLIAGGVLGHAFIPLFTSFLAHDKREQAWRLASQVINTAFLVSLFASVLAFIAAPWLVANVVAPGFSRNPQLVEETATLMRILLVSTLIFSVSGILMGILQSFNSFLLPALAPILFDVGILFGVIFLIEPLGTSGIALGAVLGAALHLAIQLPGVLHHKMRWYNILGWRDPTLRRMVRLMIPRIIDLGLFSFTAILGNNIASRLGTGAVSALNWGWQIMQIPQTLIGTAMGTVIFPTLAALSNVGDLDGKRAAMNGALQFILIGTIPSAIGLIVVGQPLVSLLESGAFDSAATALVYNTLRFFALGIVVHSVLEVIARSFYADQDTLTPLFVAFGGAAVNLTVAVLTTGVLPNGVLINPTLDIGTVGGLALANTLGVTFEVVALMIILRKRWRGLGENQLAITAIKTLIASLMMAAIILLLQAVASGLGLAGQGRLTTLALVGGQVVIGAGVFVAAAYLLKLEALTIFIRRVLRRPTPQEAA